VAYPRRVTHVWVDNCLTAKLPDREESQRTRSFFFTGMAAVAAHIEMSDQIRLYENGVMSVNLPLATQVVGARASRSTHPRSLQLINRLLELVSKHHIHIDNPFVWKTKAEVVSELTSTRQAELITRSLSCTRSRTANKKFQSHCGTCIQCLHRRISTLAGGAGELDESDGYETDFFEGPRKDGPDRVMALESITLALHCANISEAHFMSRFAEPASWVLQAYPLGERDEVTKKLIDLYRRHGVAVRSILIDAVGTRAPGVLDRTLPPSSLLALVLASQLTATALSPFEPPSVRLPDPTRDQMAATVATDDIFVAADLARQRILISDRADLHGHAIFPIMRLLMDAWMKDQRDGLLRKNHRSFRAKEIANQLVSLDDGAVRAAIKRARAELEEGSINLDGVSADPNAIIETTARGGYRLNPNLKVVTFDEFRSL
jgi:hypothetical protein